MRNHEVTVCERLKRLGFAQQNQLRLYGMEFEVTSDPIVMGEDLIFVDAVEKQTRRARRIRVPSMVVNMAKSESNAA